MALKNAINSTIENISDSQMAKIIGEAFTKAYSDMQEMDYEELMIFINEMVDEHDIEMHVRGMFLEEPELLWEVDIDPVLLAA